MRERIVMVGKVGVMGACLLGGAILGGCGTTDRTPPTATNAAPLETDAIQCGPSTSFGGRELYVLFAINHKLDTYPDLRAALGQDHVFDCDSARAFTAGYRQYSEDHPGFDRDEPLPPRPAVATPSDLKRPVLDVPKVFQGTPVMYAPSPIVRLVQVLRPGTLDEHGNPAQAMACTGTFIAKNWIVTAAHCLILGPDSSDWFGWTDWKIQWPDANGNVLDTSSLFLTALQYPEPRYIGSEAPNADSHDIALLYLPSILEVEEVLPPDIGDGHAMMLQEGEPQLPGSLADPVLFAGWGQPKGTTTPPPQLAFGMMSSNAADTDSDIVDTVTSAGQATVCAGDSGGPVIRGDSTGRLVLMGTLHGGHAGADDCVHPPTPPDTTNFEVWPRVDRQAAGPFIEGSMRDWNGPDFSCQHPLDGTDELQCWGDPCSSDADCADDEYCSRAGQDLKGPCPVCAVACDCVVGQCLPGPKLDDL